MTAVGASDGRSTLPFSRWIAETATRRRLIAWVMVGTYLAAIAAVLLIPPVYRSRASFVANSSSSNKLSSGLSSAGGLGGLATQLGVSTTVDPSESPSFYIQLIQSRELLTRLLQSRFRDPRSNNPRDSASLLSILRVRSSDPKRQLELGVKRMLQSIRGNFDIKTNLVWIDVDAQWPELAAAVANRTIELVSGFNREQRTSRARTKRVFLESRVALAKSELEAAEARHRYFYDQNRGGLRNSPALLFEEKQLQRDDDRAADLYLLLQRQLEAALLDEFNDAALITTVDAAVPPRKAVWPRWGVLVISSTVIGAVLAILVAGSAVVYDDWGRRNPDSAEFLRESIPGRRLRRRLNRSERSPRRS